MVKKVAIIGAGPSGVLLAHYLLRRDEKYQIDIYERRSDPRTVNFSKIRTFPISLCERGTNALRQIPGLEEAVKAVSVEMTGTIFHGKKGKTQVTSRKKPLVTLDRTNLANVLLEKLLENYDHTRLNVHFKHQCLQVDFAAKKLKLQKLKPETTSQEIESEFTINYDLLIGADGARSVVREHLVNTEVFECQQNYVPNAYKSIFLPNPDQTPGIDLQKNKIHTWRLSNGVAMLMLHQPDETISGVIHFPYAKNPIAELKNAEKVTEFFHENFPEIAQIMPEYEAEAFSQRPISQVLTVRCNRYHYGDSVLLIGDAAHAVSPSIGQGCNSALEDVVVLDKLLDEYADNLALTLENYSIIRQPDAFALRELSDYCFPTSKKLFTEFIIRNSLGKILHQIFPKTFFPPIFDAVFAADISYKEILHKNQNWISRVKKSNDQFFANN
ncbi:FAD-dependent oxidoreductase [Anabaena sp. WFMT]|uniref:FAD-dependent oxidoreductase n=1 Tax=Anabaena sp. WFMT TaxID=3449730 RepID=UPI003F28537D